MEPEAFGLEVGLDVLPKATAASRSVVRGAEAPPNRPKRMASAPLPFPASLAVYMWHYLLATSSSWNPSGSAKAVA
jgi:hypothetical protein